MNFRSSPFRLASVKEVPEKMNNLLDYLIEEIAYLFVSLCAIPIIVLILLIVFLKSLLGFKGSVSADSAALVREIRRILPKKEELEE